MTSISSNSKNSSNSSNKEKKDKTLQSIVNFGTVIVIIIICFLVYKYLIKKNTKRTPEGFIDTENTLDTANIDKNTIYETSIKNIYGNNTRLICGMLPNIYNQNNICIINNEKFVPYKFPIHMIKLIDGTILAVFNDGRLYHKENILSTLWAGPITNSMPNDTVPLRMVTLSTDLVTLLGVGFDNILYVKSSDKKGNINLTIPWRQVPNNSSIIYVLFDNQTNFLLSIDINGKLFTKNTFDITSKNQELVTKIDRPILRLYYDNYGYMLVVDNNFDLYQFSELNWKNTKINISRGANSSKVQDLLYDNDGKMYGIIFNPEAFMVQIMKQSSMFYLSEFYEIDAKITSNNNTETFVMSDQDIIKCKIGSLYKYLEVVNDDDNDDDPNFAYQKQIIENQKKLREFCANRNIASGDTNYDNYDLLASVDTNNDKINNLKNIINNLIAYEPDGKNIKETYPIIQN